jgi:DNA-binding transcriptional ArsR family regulator
MPEPPARAPHWHGVHRALADPLRVQIIELLWDAPRSAGELAEILGVPADRLYYHLGQLERAGLVEVAEYRRLARGKVERVYGPVEVEPPGDTADPREMAAFLGSVLDATRADVTAAFRAKQDGQRREVDLFRGTLRLTEQALGDLRGRIRQLVESCPQNQDDAGADAVWTRLVISVIDLQDRPATTRTGGSS